MCRLSAGVMFVSELHIIKCTLQLHVQNKGTSDWIETYLDITSINNAIIFKSHF